MGALVDRPQTTTAAFAAVCRSYILLTVDQYNLHGHARQQSQRNGYDLQLCHGAPPTCLVTRSLTRLGKTRTQINLSGYGLH
jgi:hypothetical protein